MVKLTENNLSIIFDQDEEVFTVITPDGFKGEFTVKERSTSLAGQNPAPGNSTANRMVATGEEFV
ncbi:MAG: hypothetical protein HC859_06390, partial [Bacteroidia bacterium]|nr:hypothetical protein [Bacteroidia bacterium]